MRIQRGNRLSKFRVPLKAEVLGILGDDSRPAASVQRQFLPEEVVSEITLRIGPMVFKVESRTSAMTQIITHYFSTMIDHHVVGSPRLVCESGWFSDRGFTLRVSGRTVEPRSHYWILRSAGFEATYFPRYRMAWAAMPEKLPPFLALLQMLFPFWLEDRGGMLILGSTVVHQDRSYLLVEDSTLTEEQGAGASKATLLSRGEISLLARSEDGKFMAYQTPLGGNMRPGAPSLGAPLAEIFICSGDTSSGEASLGEAQAFSHLYSKILPFAENPSRLGAMRDQVSRLTQNVPVHPLPRGSDFRFFTGNTAHH